jgi:hypothetical protein
LGQQEEFGWQGGPNGTASNSNATECLTIEIVSRMVTQREKSGVTARHLQERLVVMTRLPFDGATASAIVSARQVPVLVIEPERLPPGEGASRT